jgi:hypothetical protein
MTTSVAVLAGSVSTAVFMASALPMLVKAARTKDLGSYSFGNLVLANLGNLVYAVYVFSLPVGPIWALHSFYMVSSFAMLVMWLGYRRRRVPLRRSALRRSRSTPTSSSSLGLGLGHLCLNAFRRRAPDGQPSVVTVVAEEHDEAHGVPCRRGATPLNPRQTCVPCRRG